MSEEESLKIETTPSLAKTQAASSGVKMLNNKPLLIVFIIIFLIIAGLAYAVSLRGQKTATNTKAAQGELTKSNDGQKQAKQMFDDLEQNTSQVNAHQETNASDPLGQIPKSQSQQTGNNTIPAPGQPVVLQGQTQTTGGTVSQDKYDKVSKLYEAKIAQTKISFDRPTNIGTSTNTNNPQQNSGLSPQNSVYPGALTSVASMIGQSQQTTDNEARNQSWLNSKESQNSPEYLDAKIMKPKSPYELKAGSVIPGVLISGVNSDLPGQLIAQVSENVYDTKSGRLLLVPQGARLVGVYSANVIFGQERVLIAWNRIIFPNGKSISINAMPGADQAGYAGFKDQVDNHYAKIYGGAFMLSLITGGIAMTNKNNGTQMTQTPSDQMVSSIVQGMGEVGKQMVQKSMNVSPTLGIRPGYRFNIFVTKDMILELYKK